MSPPPVESEMSTCTLDYDLQSLTVRSLLSLHIGDNSYTELCEGTDHLAAVWGQPVEISPFDVSV